MKKIASYCIVTVFFISACGLLPGDSSGVDTTNDSVQEVAQVTENNTSDEAASESNNDTTSEENAAQTPADDVAADSAETADTASGETSLASCNVDPLGLPKNSKIADLSPNDWMKGDAAENSITIVEYGDFQ